MKIKSKKEIELQSYHRVAAHGAFWNVGLAVANKIVTLVGQIVLAWLLSPSDMGLAGMAVAMTGFTAFLSAGGIGDVLIQRKRYEKEAGQGLWLSIVLSIFTASLIALMAPVMKATGRPVLSGLLFILAISSLVGIPNTVLGGRLKNNLDFKHVAVSHFIEGVVYTSFTLLFALLKFGPYALVLPIIPRLLAGAAYMVWREGFPTFERVNFRKIKELVRPTLSLGLTGFFVGLQTQAPIFLVGLVLDSTETGHFTWGWSVAGQAVFLLAINLRQVLMPIFAKIGNNKKRQMEAVFKSIRVMTAVLIVFCGLQALLAKPLLDAFFPAKWHPAGPVITWISLGLVFQGIWISVSSWLNAVGRYRDLLWISLVPAVLAAGAAFLGAHLNGSQGAAIGTAIGISLGFLSAFSRLSVGYLLANIGKILIPFLISLGGWTATFYVSSGYSLIFKIMGAGIYLFVSCFAWWCCDDGTLKKLLPSSLQKRN